MASVPHSTLNTLSDMAPTGHCEKESAISTLHILAGCTIWAMPPHTHSNDEDREQVWVPAIGLLSTVIDETHSV